MTEKKSPKSQKKESEQVSTKKTKVAEKVRNIGIKVKSPKDTCENDKNCPFHGQVSLRGRVIKATVVRKKIPKNALVEWTWKSYVPKYERYEKKRTRIMVHCPECLNVKVGDAVRIMETRKISKIKNYIIIEIIESKNIQE